MFRSRVSGLLMTLALLAGVVALAAWVGTTTVLSPARVTHAAGTLLQSPQGRDALAQELTDRAMAVVPESERSAVESAARTATAEPRSAQLLEDLANADSPRERDAAAGAMLDGLARVSPATADRLRRQLDDAGGVDALARERVGGDLPAAGQGEPVLGPFAAFVPSSVSTALDRARSAALAVQQVGWAAAALLGVGALLLGPRRDRLLRRIGHWGVAVGAVALVAGVVLAELVLPQWDSLWAAVAADTLRSSQVTLGTAFGLILAGGVACWVLGIAAGQLRPDRDRSLDRYSEFPPRHTSRPHLGHRAEFPEAYDDQGQHRGGDWGAPRR